MIPGEFPLPRDELFPKMVVLSITNACDYACTHCYHRRYVKQPGYRRQDLETAVFRKIANEVGAHPGSILRFIAWGEPLLHPRVVEFTQHARQAAPRNPLTLITNGYGLTPDRSRALMEADLDLVEVSIDAATQETYRQVRVSRHADAFLRVERNVREMVRQRDRSGFRTRIAVSFIAHPTRESTAEFALFAEKWDGVADEVVRRPAHTFRGSVAGTAPPPGPRPPCYGLWARCSITPYGQIGVCYSDWESRSVLGDLWDPGTTIASIWQGPALTRLRAGQRRGIFVGICAACHDYNPDAWNRPYEQVVGRCCERA